MKFKYIYDQESNKGTYLKNGYAVLIYDFNSEVIDEMYEDFTDTEQSFIIDDLRKEKQSFDDNKGYDVRLEQGLYDYGY